MADGQIKVGDTVWNIEPEWDDLDIEWSKRATLEEVGLTRLFVGTDGRQLIGIEEDGSTRCRIPEYAMSTVKEALRAAARFARRRAKKYTAEAEMMERLAADA